MNFTESFDQFSSRLTPTDLALYAGFGIALWVIFKDKLSPVQQVILNLVKKTKDLLNNKKSPAVESSIPLNAVSAKLDTAEVKNPTEDLFFKLVVSWKQTRDLAAQSKCDEAVRVADEMFPYLSPNVCQEKKEKSDE